ncbi:MAG: TetR/AcrR family transcriptional regulator [Clostridiales bacterium]|nr:TetR/AcrR family transcriptional regulator [Clostridiales bacterium]
MRKGPRKKQDILNTAAVLFAEKGYVNTSIQDILDQLNTSKGSFYHHFKTKFEVLADLTKAQAQQSFARYESSRPFDALSALNALLREASFITRENLPILRNLIALPDYEGTALLREMQDAVTAIFFPAFVSIMTQLRQMETAIFSNVHSLRVAFTSLLSASALLIEQAKKTDEKADTLPLLRAIRRHLEAALGMSPGAIVIIEASELALILQEL